MKPLLDVVLIAALYLAAYRFPMPSGRGWLEAAASFLLPAAVFWAVGRGRRLGWIFLGIAAGILVIFSWVPEVMAAKGGIPWAGALPLGLLFYAYEAAGFLGVAFLGRLGSRRGPLAGAFAAALAMVVWETWIFHIYDLSPGAALGALPWTAKGAAFAGTHGLSALLWGLGAFTGLQAARRAGLRRVLAAPALLLALLGAAALAWRGLPRGPQRELDVVMIQPDFEPGLRRPGMEADMWARTDAALKAAALPRPGCATLVLWPESSVLGRDDRWPSPRLRWEAQRRGVAWLFGTEGGALNLVRGEAGGAPSFIQAKVTPMAFGERNPGPKFFREWLDRQMGIQSQEPGTLGPHSSFRFDTPQGPLKAHPLICSEALLETRVAQGLREAGGDLLANITNDGWFERSPATDLHAVQIRLRPVECGIPMLRATLTGKSGLFREDGSWQLWGAPMTEASYTLHLAWRPISTPARDPHLAAFVALALASGLALAWIRKA